MSRAVEAVLAWFLCGAVHEAMHILAAVALGKTGGLVRRASCRHRPKHAEYATTSPKRRSPLNTPVPMAVRTCLRLSCRPVSCPSRARTSPASQPRPRNTPMLTHTTMRPPRRQSRIRTSPVDEGGGHGSERRERAANLCIDRRSRGHAGQHYRGVRMMRTYIFDLDVISLRVSAGRHRPRRA